MLLLSNIVYFTFNSEEIDQTGRFTEALQRSVVLVKVLCSIFNTHKYSILSGRLLSLLYFVVDFDSPKMRYLVFYFQRHFNVFLPIPDYTSSTYTYSTLF